MSYELSRVYYRIDKTAVTLCRLILLGLLLYAVKSALLVGADTVFILLSALVIGACIGHIYMLHRQSYKRYKNYTLGDSEYPSVHIGYTEGVFEITHVNKHAYIPFRNIHRVGTFNMIFAVCVWVRSTDESESCMFLLDRQNAIDFRTSLRHEVAKYNSIHSTYRQENQENYRKQYKRHG